MCFCAVRRKCLVSHNCGKVRLPQTFRPTKGFRLCKHRQVIVSPQLLTILMLEIAKDYCCWCHCFVNTAMASNTTPNSLIVVWLEIWWNHCSFFDEMLNTFGLPRIRKRPPPVVDHTDVGNFTRSKHNTHGEWGWQFYLKMYYKRFFSWRHDSLTSFLVHTCGL